MLHSNDFYMQRHDNFDTILHLPSSHVINVKSDTEVALFFRQLLFHEISYSQEDFEELHYLVSKEFEFINQKTDLADEIGETNMQTIILPISGHCNLRCSYCFAQTKGDFGFKDITPQKCKEIVDFVLKNNRPDIVCSLNFFGGEPMLNMETIQETIEYTKLNYPNRNVAFGITTNGTILKEDELNFIKEHQVKLLVSYDGPASIAPHRVYVNGKHSEENVIRNIEKLKQNNIDFQLRATISSDCNSLKNIYEYFESLNLPFAAVLAYKSRNVDDTCVYDGKIESFKQQYKDLLNYYRNRIEKGDSINCFSIMNDVITIKTRRLKQYACGGGINIFAVTDNGNIFSCEHLAFDSKYAIGNIASGINKKSLKEMQPSNVNSITGCDKCWIKYYCSAGCFSEKILIGRHHQTLESEECDLKRIYWDFILSLYVLLENKEKGKNRN